MLSNWASCNDLALVYDSKQKGTFVSARWQREYSPDLCWVSSVCGHPQPAMSSVLGNFPHSQHRPSVIHIGVTLPVIHSTNNKRWNFRKADWGNFTRKTENSTPLIPRQQIAFEEAYTRCMGAFSSAAHATIPEAFVFFIFHVWTKKQRISATIRRIRRPGHRRQSHKVPERSQT